MAKNNRRNTFTLRSEELIQMLQSQWVKGYVTAICEDQISTSDAVNIPMDNGGPETVAWIMEISDELNTMRRRSDGTFYMPRTKLAKQ